MITRGSGPSQSRAIRQNPAKSLFYIRICDTLYCAFFRRDERHGPRVANRSVIVDDFRS